MGGGARSAPVGVAMSPKRRVRAAHGRSRAAKTHYGINNYGMVVTVTMSIPSGKKAYATLF
jgi:hypothetical protein